MWGLVFQTIPVVAWFVSVLVVVAPLKLRRQTSLFIALALAVAFGKFAFFALVGGNGFNPRLPSGIIWFCGWAYAAAMMLTGFSFAAVLVDGVLRLVRHPVTLRVIL